VTSPHTRAAPRLILEQDAAVFRFQSSGAKRVTDWNGIQGLGDLKGE
jgi:hypothetical protein